MWPLKYPSDLESLRYNVRLVAYFFAFGAVMSFSAIFLNPELNLTTKLCIMTFEILTALEGIRISRKNEFINNKQKTKKFLDITVEVICLILVIALSDVGGGIFMAVSFIISSLLSIYIVLWLNRFLSGRVEALMP